MRSLLPCIVLLSGSYFFIRLRGFMMLHPLRTARLALTVFKDRESFRSCALAMAGTLGVGNVLGVCVGISVGGAGALLWIFISGIFSSVIKYCEVVLARDNIFRDGRGAHGGFYYVIRATLGGRWGGAVAVGYALLTVALSLLMGAALQSNAAVGSICEIFNTSPYVISVFFAVFVALGVFGGAAIIERITAIIIPIATIVYIIMTLSVIIVNSSALPSVLNEIVTGAFELRAGIGGVLGFLLSPSVREGFCRGVLSNEAGVGTSSMAHSRGGILSPAVSGIVGTLEVFFDTTLLCTLTGFSVLCAEAKGEGINMILSAVVTSLGRGWGIVLAALVLAFAYATVICWYYYGRESLLSLLPPSASLPFFALFTLSCLFGALVGDGFIVYAIDYILLLASVPVCVTLVKSSDRIVELSELGGVLGNRRSIRLKRRLGLKGAVSSKARADSIRRSSCRIPPR